MLYFQQKEDKMINIIRSEKVSPTEVHFEIEINGKVIQFAKWVDDDFCTDYEFLKGEELLNDDEQEEVYDFIQEQVI